MPMLPERRLSPFDTLGREFPIGVQPIGVADHDNESVFGLTPGLLTFRGGNLPYLKESIAQLTEAFVRLQPSRVSIGMRSTVCQNAGCNPICNTLWFTASVVQERADQLVLAHRVPTGQTFRTGHLCQLFTALIAKRGCG